MNNYSVYLQKATKGSWQESNVNAYEKIYIATMTKQLALYI